MGKLLLKQSNDASIEVPLQIKECSGKPEGAGETFPAEALIKGCIKLKSNSIKWVKKKYIKFSTVYK